MKGKRCIPDIPELNLQLPLAPHIIGMGVRRANNAADLNIRVDL
jgi:hypothetical protein